jgi:hypothetical protein
MRNTQLGDKIKIVQCCAPTIGTAGTQTTVEVNGTGYERALWILGLGAVTGGATIDLKIRNAVATGMGTDADQTGAVLVQIPDTGGAKVYTIDAPVSPTRPFMKPTLVTTTQAAVNYMICILYKGTTYPIATSYATQAVVV